MTELSPPAPASPAPAAVTEVAMRRHMARGAIWMVAMRWAMRGIGVVNTVIMARLLTPEDFGIVAIAMLVVGLIETFGDAGQQLALIRHPNPTRELYDSAWTISVIIGSVLTLAVLLAAPLTESYFDTPVAVLVTQVLALRVLFSAFENIGTVAFRRELDFAREFRFWIYKKLAMFAVTVVLGVMLRNYWALVGGIVAGAATGTLISFLVHPYRPRFCLSKIHEIWSFSLWILVGAVASFLQGRLDQYIVGAVGDPDALGKYTVATDLATMPTEELVLPLARGLFPAYAKLSDHPTELRDAYLNVLSYVAILCCSAGPGIALIAPDLAAVLLGPQWLGIAPLIVWLALTAAVFAYSNTVMVVLQAAGQARAFALQAWNRILMLLPLLALAAHVGTVEGIAVARFVGTVLLVPALFHSLRQVIPLTTGQIVAATWRPMLAAGAMAVAILAVPPALLAAQPILRLMLLVPLGAVTFTAALGLLWLAAGRPFGPEEVAWRTLRLRLPRRASGRL